MYEVKCEAREFVGNDQDEAVAKACSFFGVDQDALSLMNPAAGEIYGLAGRAVVVAIPKDADRGPRRSEPDRGFRRSEGRRFDSGRSEGRARDRDRRGQRGDTRSNRREPEPLRQSEPEAPAAPVEDSTGEVIGEIGPIGEFLMGALERMAIGSFTIAEDSEGEFLVYKLRGPAAIEIGSGDGRAVDALQLLANQYGMRIEAEARRVVVDAEGDPERREGFLSRLAERAARRARDTRRSVALDPMNSRDRRTVHVSLRDADGIATMSIGSGPYRQVVVVPEDSPEYEDARRSMEDAEARQRHH